VKEDEARGVLIVMLPPMSTLDADRVGCVALRIALKFSVALVVALA
jgi:hypothetical protein